MTPAFDSLSAFFAMGGYGPYVWTCYGVFFGCMGLTALMSVRQRKHFEADLRQYWRRVAGNPGTDTGGQSTGHSGQAFGPVDQPRP